MRAEIGEIRKGLEVGYKNNTKVIWFPCAECGKERWVQFVKRRPVSSRCKHCGPGSLPGSANPAWKGGRTEYGKGYFRVVVSSTSPFFPMAAKDGKTPEHRLIMAQHLGRCLLKSEQVHHLNGVKCDNRVKNLELISPANHVLYKRLCSKCILRKEIYLLREQMKNLIEQLNYKLLPSQS